MGGTGKTPHIEYFIRLYQNDYKIAVLSRGYGRNTKGYFEVNRNEEASRSGDEPLQIKQNFPSILVVVCENRVLGIETILKAHPEINLILLDDAYQHRYVKPGLNILLTPAEQPFWKDYVVPAGRLREFRLGWKRADAIIITKCENNSIPDYPKYLNTKPVYSSQIVYRKPEMPPCEVIVVSGIVNPKPMLDYLIKEGFKVVHHFEFKDHHQFTPSDIAAIYDTASKQGIPHVFTTQKDAVKLLPMWNYKDVTLSALNIEIAINNPPQDWFKL